METTDHVCRIPILLNRYFDIICRMALVPSRSDEIEKLKLPGDLDPVTFDLELDPPNVCSHVPRITHAKFHLIPSNGLAANKGQTYKQTYSIFLV